jgi:hypothetical protein
LPSRPLKKFFLLSLRAKRSNLVAKNIKYFKIAASQNSLPAMTIQDFFSKLLQPVQLFADLAHDLSNRLGADAATVRIEIERGIKGEQPCTQEVSAKAGSFAR